MYASITKVLEIYGGAPAPLRDREKNAGSVPRIIKAIMVPDEIERQENHTGGAQK